MHHPPRVGAAGEAGICEEFKASMFIFVLY